MFNLESSVSYGELIFLEHYQEVIKELAKVEHKIDAQSLEGPVDLKQSVCGRSTLQAIGNAAAAGGNLITRCVVTLKCCRLFRYKGFEKQ